MMVITITMWDDDGDDGIDDGGDDGIDDVDGGIDDVGVGWRE